jgi:hypothetical protein
MRKIKENLAANCRESEPGGPLALGKQNFQPH